MTDKEIIKALEYCCIKHSCSECPYKRNNGCGCINGILKDALDLINRQQTEIDRLKEEEEKYPFKCVMPFNSMVCSKSIEDYDRLVGDIWADAITKFAESLNEKVENARKKYQRLCKEQGEKEDEAMNIHFKGIIKLINNLVKELVGGD